MSTKDELLRRLSNIEKLLEERKTKPLNFNQAAEYLGFSHSYLYKLTSQRKLPAHKPNGKYLYFYKDELDEWIISSEKSKGRSEKEETQDSEMEEDEEPP